jgi:ribosomal protein L1
MSKNKKRQTADEIRPKRSGKKPIKSKLALLKKNKRSKKSNKFDVEIMVSESNRHSEQEVSGSINVGK